MAFKNILQKTALQKTGLKFFSLGRISQKSYVRNYNWYKSRRNVKIECKKINGKQTISIHCKNNSQQAFPDLQLRIHINQSNRISNRDVFITEHANYVDIRCNKKLLKVVLNESPGN